VNRKCPPGTRFYNFQLPTPILSPQAVHLLNHRPWGYLANTSKPYCSTAEIYIVDMLHGYSRQRRTIGSFSATVSAVMICLLIVVIMYSNFKPPRRRMIDYVDHNTSNTSHFINLSETNMFYIFFCENKSV